MIIDLHKLNKSLRVCFSKQWTGASLFLLISFSSVSSFAIGETVDATVSEPDEQNIITETEALKAVDSIGEDQEMHLPADEVYTRWEMQDVEQIDDRIEKKNVLEQEVSTKKLKNVVPPILFKSGEADIPENYVELLRDALNKVKHRNNVRLHFIGHTDDVKLSGSLKRKYKDNVGLSRERAGTTAEYFQRALKLPPEAISYDGMGEHEPADTNSTNAGRAKNRRVEVQVWYDEIKEKMVEKDVVVAGEMTRIKVCRIETVCKLRYKEGHSQRARVKNLVPAFQYQENISGVSDQFLRQISQAMANLKGKENITIKLIGHTDNIPLVGREQRIYGNHAGLSKARARRAALAVQEALHLPNKAITSDGRGADLPIASNESEKGRSLNRRIEVEFWYDDALAELPDEPQVCPEQAAAETITRVHEPPSGNVQPVYFDKGKPVMPLNYDGQLRMILDGLKGKSNIRLRFIGYTANERLDRRTMMIYGDDIGLSTARARRVKELVMKELGLTDKQVEHEGRGNVQSDDVVNVGFSENDSSHVVIEAIYDDLATMEEEEGLEITRFKRVVKLKDPYALNLMRITVDGKPLHDPNKSSQDMQRCTDTALEKANVQLHYDGLELKPRLNVSAWPTAIRYQDRPETEHYEDEVRFKVYSNYPSFIKKAEVRIFDKEQSLRDTPLAIVEVDENGYAQWRADYEVFQAPGRELKYLLRVYDENENYDQTETQLLWIVDNQQPGLRDLDAEKELLIGFGKSRLAQENIKKNGGTIRVNGSDIPADHNVWVAGRSTPVTDDGKFIFEEIIPVGLHTMEVAVLDQSGGGELFLRDLKFDDSEWFYVGIADVTASKDSTNGPAQLVTGDKSHYDNDLDVDGRIAYYVKGKFWTDWELTSSMDTLEGPIEDMFSNFLNKSPDALFRRMDPDYYYPTYGDDGTVEEGAPTLGKFYFKLNKNYDHLLWGNFNTSYVENDLAHVDRGLYGLNLHYQADKTTSFGEKVFSFDGFAADPGTVAGRDEFRGTGGSVYFLRHQDILTGSDRVRIEIRDKDSGMVVAVKNLTAVLDYDVDYLQGRIMLSEPFSATVSNGMLVSVGGSTGDEAHLVVRYEYTPGFDKLDTVITGGNTHVWLADMLKLGVTASSTDDGVTESSLTGADITLRKNTNTWLKLQSANSDGLGPETLLSNNGGYDFTTVAQPTTGNVSGSANRVDISLGLDEVSDDFKGKFTAYKQDVDAGYSAPGIVAINDTEQSGASLDMAVTDAVKLRVKLDKNHKDLGLKTSASEINIELHTDGNVDPDVRDELDTETISETEAEANWTTSVGFRDDNRKDDSAVVPLTQKQGKRSEILLKTEYDSKQKWSGYIFHQNTFRTTGNREDNNRLGVGGAYRTSDRFKLNSELSGGSFGLAAKLGTEYLYNDRNTLYSNYSLDNERTDNGLSSRRGNMVTGVRTKYSDSASIYVEEKYTHGDVPTGLTNTLGIDLTPDDKWNVGAKIDIGELKDQGTGATTSRQAYGIDVGYGFDSIKFASALEYRVDESEDLNLVVSKRTTWLTKNTLKYQFTPDWRFITKLNHSESKSTLGEFYSGDFTEAVLGYGYRPVNNDRLNALVKYTYFYSLPTADQVIIENTAVGFIQKSEILSLDMSYELTRDWTLGGKYGYRIGQIAYDRVNPEFFSNNISLYVLRADWHMVNKWDLLIEARTLQQPDIGDSRGGMLTGLYRHMGKNVKLGFGYNFTDFSDDLTDLDYDSKGWFINIIGKI